MKKSSFYILDVFTDKKYAGNQLAVFRDAAGIPGEEMQQIAREINFSETTFILSEEPNNGGYDVRIFTPRRRYPLPGIPPWGPPISSAARSCRERLIRLCSTSSWGRSRSRLIATTAAR